MLACLLAVAAVQAQGPGTENPSPAVSIPDDPSLLLNLSLAAAWSRFGPPLRLFSVRGLEPWQDDVGFEYEGGLSLYWYRDRLWQIRLSDAYRGSCFGVFPGDSAEKALSLLGPPDRSEAAWLEWRLPYRGYPVRLRAGIREGSIHEMFVYRSDF